MTQDSMDSGWYYAKAGSHAGSEIGPLSWGELYLLARGGTLGSNDIVWNPRLPHGVVANLVPGLIPEPAALEVPAAQELAPQTAPLTQAVPPTQPAVPPTQPAVPQVQPASPEAPPPAAPVAPTPQVSPVVEVPAKCEVPAIAPQTLATETSPPKAKGQSRSLPYLVVLLVLVLAAAGLAAYFLFLRDTVDSPGDASPAVTTTTVTTPSGPTSALTAAASSAVWAALSASADAPTTRSGHATAYDPGTDRTILFGGSHADAKLGDTWALDLATNTWTALRPSGRTPTARDYHQMTYDPVSKRIILFGGTDATGDRDDLWTYDPGTDVWTELKPSGPLPAARAGHSMVYEPTTERMLVFGGLSSKTNSGLNDLWAYDPAVNTWTRISPPGDTPAPRTMATMVYSVDSRRVLMFGGLALSATTTGEFNDLWAYDPAIGTWTEIKPSGITPAPRQAHAMIAAPTLGGLLMYGGRNAQTDLDETWLYDSMAASWTRLEPLGGTPGARDGHTMVYDATAGAVILFGGYDPASALELGDTWVFGPASEESAL